MLGTTRSLLGRGELRSKLLGVLFSEGVSPSTSCQGGFVGVGIGVVSSGTFSRTEWYWGSPSQDSSGEGSQLSEGTVVGSIGSSDGSSGREGV